MSGVICRIVSQLLSREVVSSCNSSLTVGAPVRNAHWFASVLSLKTSVPLRAEPKKKKKVDPRREQIARERLRKRLKKMERVPPELIPIEDFMTPSKYLDNTRVRSMPALSFEESERRALLLKEWSRYKQVQYKSEMAAIATAQKAQRQALEELRLESEELYQAAIRPDLALFPFHHQGPCHTPSISNHEAPDGKYNDITRVYTQ